METFLTLLTLCEGNPPATIALPSHWTSNVDLWFSLLLANQNEVFILHMTSIINNWVDAIWMKWCIFLWHHCRLTDILHGICGTGKQGPFSIYDIASKWNHMLSCQLRYDIIKGSSPPGQYVRHFADDIFKCIFINEKSCILIWISLKFFPKCPIDNKSSLV